jgi:hypothetical protein
MECTVCASPAEHICRCGASYCSVDCQTFDWHEEGHAEICNSSEISKEWISGRPRASRISKHPPSRTKAREMLHNPPHGRALTEKQRKYFGYLANR